MIGDALATLKAFATQTAAEDGFYPQSATLERVGGGASATVRLRLSKPREQQNFNVLDENRHIARNPAHIGVFPPMVLVQLGDRLTMLEPSDVAGQVFEVVEPIKPDTLGYTCGLAFVSGAR
jgi:hypothetical protein